MRELSTPVRNNNLFNKLLAQSYFLRRNAFQVLNLQVISLVNGSHLLHLSRHVVLLQLAKLCVSPSQSTVMVTALKFIDKTSVRLKVICLIV